MPGGTRTDRLNWDTAAIGCELVDRERTLGDRLIFGLSTVHISQGPRRGGDLCLLSTPP